jgi:hypothetical protein
MIKKAPDGTEYLVLEPRSKWRSTLDWWLLRMKLAWWRSRRTPAPTTAPSPVSAPEPRVGKAVASPWRFATELDEPLEVRGGSVAAWFPVGPLTGSMATTLHFVSPSDDGTDVIRTVFACTGSDGGSHEHVTDNLPGAFFDWLVENQGAELPAQADPLWLTALAEMLVVSGAKAMLDDRNHHHIVINGQAREVATHYLAFTLDLAFLDDDFPQIVARMTGLHDTEGDMLPPLVFTVPIEEFISWHTATYSEEDEMWTSA